MTTSRFSIAELLVEHDRAVAYTDELWADLTQDEVHWRSSPNSSAIGWHLGHQAAVSHYMVRNLTAAEPPIDDALDRLMDSATSEPDRGDLPDLARLRGYRNSAAERLHLRIGNIAAGDVGAPQQLEFIAIGLVLAVTNHEYQHSQWIGEVRARDLGHHLPNRPTSDLLTEIDGYLVVGA
ncbi:DinB family protein [uncultured Ilumatobacter sp.]|uniref:DinB family protein n=1 Tax=uncultured Ilumatobacter sp. TaxID=879968 RepID=UPI00374F1EEC